MISPVMMLALALGPAVQAQLPIALNEGFSKGQVQAFQTHANMLQSVQNLPAEKIQAAADTAESLSRQASLLKQALEELETEASLPQSLPASFPDQMDKESAGLAQLAKDVDTLQKIVENFYFEASKSPALKPAAKNLLDQSASLFVNANELESEAMQDAGAFTAVGATFVGGEFQLDAGDARFSSEQLMESDSKYLYSCIAHGAVCPLKAPATH